jgi:hypothetical protein
MMNRRTFLCRLAIGAAWAAGALGTGLFDEVRAGRSPNRRRKPAGAGLRSLHRDSFVPHLSTRFQVYPPTGQPIPMTLVRTDDLSLSPDIESFRLLFRTPRKNVLAQGTYALEHDVMGKASLFLVPVFTRDRGFQEYEAVFTRRVSRSRQAS